MGHPGPHTVNHPLKTHTVWVIPLDSAAVVFPLPLRGTDRVNFEIAISSVDPGPLDEELLVTALQTTLTFYPHASGRLLCHGNDWSLVAGKRGVPITFETIDEPLNHHQHPSFVPTAIVDSICLDIVGARKDEPMLRLKITFCPKTKHTFIGWSCNHILALSNQGTGIGSPTYEHYCTAPPDEINDNASTASFIERYLPHLRELFPMDDLLQMNGKAYETSTPVDILLTADQIQQLRAIADSSPGSSGSGTSAHDAIVGYVVSTMNRCLEKEQSITRVGTIVSYRGIDNPSDLDPADWHIPGPLAAGNIIAYVYTPILSPEEAQSMGVIAAAIRKSVKDARNYEHIKRLVAISNPIV